MTSVSVVSESRAGGGRRWPKTFWIGAGIIAVCEVLLFLDVHLSGRGPVRSTAERLAVAAPASLLAYAARWVAVNMTALVWVGYIIFLEGLLTVMNGTSPARKRPHHFALLCLASIFVWGVFDMINFNLDMRAWVYIGMPGTKGIAGDFFDRGVGYFLAFATVVPGMLLSGQVLLDLGVFGWARRSRNTGILPVRAAQNGKGASITEERDSHGLEARVTELAARRFKMPRWVLSLSFLVGVGMVVAVIVARTPVINYVLWMSLVFLLDPINYWLGRPSMFRDWERGWFGRTLAACAGGLICGFLWEFWNYWALTKWTYHLPFLGVTEQNKYFEMPLVGLLGFIPFGVECWVMWQMIRIPFDGLAEPIPGDRLLL